MAIKFKTKKELKIVSRCLICGKIIISGKILCSVCANKEPLKTKKSNKKMDWLDFV